jgi:hypothetical protein
LLKIAVVFLPLLTKVFGSSGKDKSPQETIMAFWRLYIGTFWKLLVIRHQED